MVRQYLLQLIAVELAAVQHSRLQLVRWVHWILPGFAHLHAIASVGVLAKRELPVSNLHRHDLEVVQPPFHYVLLSMVFVGCLVQLIDVNHSITVEV